MSRYCAREMITGAEMSKRMCFGSAYVDADFLYQSGFEDEVREKLREVSWEGLLNLKEDTFVHEVGEFLATVHRVSPSEPGVFKIGFKFGSNLIEIDYEQIRRILGIEEAEVVHHYNGELSNTMVNAWWELIGKDKNSIDRHVKSIKDPMYFYIYHLFVGSVFGRLTHGDTEVSMMELFILTCVRRGLTPDWVEMLLGHWISIRHQHRTVVCGGPITTILKGCELIQDARCKRYARYFDFDRCLALRWIYIFENGSVLWIYPHYEETSACVLTTSKRSGDVDLEAEASSKRSRVEEPEQFAMLGKIPHSIFTKTHEFFSKGLKMLKGIGPKTMRRAPEALEYGEPGQY